MPCLIWVRRTNAAYLKHLPVRVCPYAVVGCFSVQMLVCLQGLMEDTWPVAQLSDSQGDFDSPDSQASSCT